MCRKFFSTIIFLLMVCCMSNEKVFAEIVSVRGIAEVYGDGEKISSAIVEYPKNISAQKISVQDFQVEGKIIESIEVGGKFVTLNFRYENTAFDGQLMPKPNHRKDDKPMSDAPRRSDRKIPDLKFSVKQVNTIFAIDGTKFLPDEKICESITAPIIEKFQQFIYVDAETGLSIPYNLYLPEGYDADKKYPLLFFVADASANINEVTTPLWQGNGATIWATDESQLKNPCIILAPQYTADLVDEIGMMTTDENVWTQGLSLVTNLLFDVINKYSVDKTRIYGAGQSQGGMANIAISDKYPELFAAQMLVACQWNVDEMKILKDKNLWIIVCEGDTKAFPTMNAAVERWKNLGAKVATTSKFCDSKSSVAELDAQVKSLATQGANINYTVFAGGNHMYTWSFAYNIDAIRDWIFSKKNLGVD